MEKIRRQIIDNPEARVTSQLEIVRPKPEDWQILRYLKIRSVIEDPLAFEDQATGLEKYKNRTEKEWKKALDFKKSSRVSLFAKSVEGYVGMAFADVNNDYACIKHVWVDENSRRQGIGEKQLKTLLSILEDEHKVKRVSLTVLVTQKEAIRLYNKLGFRASQILKNSAKRGDGIYDKYKMELDLS